MGIHIRVFMRALVFRFIKHSLSLRINCEQPSTLIKRDMGRKIWIDTDCGTDDAEALLIALNKKDIEIIGISTISGNCSAVQVAKNVLKVLKVAHNTTIPIYGGCESSLLGKKPESHYCHGTDGLGDGTEHIIVDKEIETKNASTAIVDVFKNNPGQIELITIGPLTNIALALKLDSKFGSYVKHCYIMGGNYQGVGNITDTAEFNFYQDPEAAYIVLNEMHCEKTLACWELCLKHICSWEWYQNHINLDSEKARFVKAINVNNLSNIKINGYVTADQILLAAVIDEAVVKKSDIMNCTVELTGSLTRGMMVIKSDDLGRQTRNSTMNVKVIKELYQDMYEQILDQALID